MPGADLTAVIATPADLTDARDDAQAWAEGDDAAPLSGGGTVERSAKGHAEDAGTSAAAAEVDALLAQVAADSVAEADASLAELERQRRAYARDVDLQRGQTADATARGGDALPTPVAEGSIALARGMDAEGAILGGSVLAGVKVTDVVEGGQSPADPLPLLRGDRAIPAGDWVSNGDGTYYVDWAHVAGSDKGLVHLQVVDADGEYLGDQIARYDSLGGVVGSLSEPGYHVSYGAGSGPATSPVRITVNTAGLGAPTTGAVRFRAAYNRNPVRLATRGQISGLRAQGGVHENGFEAQGDATIERTISRRLPVHAVTIVDIERLGIIRDCIAAEMVPATNSGADRAFVFTIATPTQEGAEALFERAVYRGYGMTGTASEYAIEHDTARAFYTHPASGSTVRPALARIVDGAVYDCDGAVFCEANRVEVDGLYVENVRAPLVATTRNLVTTRMTVRNPGTDTMRTLPVEGSSVGTWVFTESHIRGGLAKLITLPTGMVLTLRRMVLDDTAKVGCVKAPSGLTATRCVFRTTSTVPSTGIMVDVTGAVSMDYNLYVGPFKIRSDVSGSVVTYTSLAAWQAASGQDAHSVHISDPLAVFDPADTGDARIDPAALSGTDLALDGVGLTRPALRWPTHATVADVVRGRGDIFPLFPSYALTA